MKKIKMTSKNAITALAVMVSVLLLCVNYAHSGLNDSSDRLSNDQAGIFSPGYINAAKQRTDSIISQLNKPKSLIENSTEYAKNELGDNVKEDALDKPVPELKKKTGGTGENRNQSVQTAQNSEAVAVSTDVDQDDVSAYIRDKVQIYINGQGNSESYQIKNAGEKYYTVWKHNDGTVKAQVFDAGGNAVLASPVTLNGLSSSYSVRDVVTLSNGNLAVFGVKQSFDMRNYVKYQIIDSSGDTVFASSSDTSWLLNSANIRNITALSDGRLAVFWDQWGPAGIKYQVLNSTGNVASASPLTISGISSSANIQNITALSNGNLAVIWSEQGSNGQSSNKYQIINSTGSAAFASPAELNGIASSAYIQNVTALSNGNLAIFWNDWSSRSVTYQVINSAGNTVFATPASLSGVSKDPNIQNVTALSNGNVAIFWGEWDSNYQNYSTKYQIIGSVGNALLTSPSVVTGLPHGDNIRNVTALSSGNLVVFWNEYDSSGRFSFKYQLMNSYGSAMLTSPTELNGVTPSAYIQNVTALSSGNLAVFWGQWGSDWQHSSQTQMIDQAGSFAPIATLSPPSIQASGDLVRSIIASQFLNQRMDPKQISVDDIRQVYMSLSDPNNAYASKGVSAIFKGLLDSKSMLAGGINAQPGSAAIAGINRESLQVSALSLPIGNMGTEDMQLAVILASIIKNPTEDQKQVLDAVTTLLKEVNKQQQESDSSELKKAADDLLQMTAAVLIAQAIPDLLKEGDVANIKGVFSELNVTKNKIMLDYQKSTKPYYDEVIKELSKNMSILQVKNIISNNMTDEELAKLPRNEIDKIFEKLKQAKDKSFETEYLLQQESKYRKAYIDPNKKLLEEKMKAMMKEFTGRLSRSLEETGAMKK